MFHESRQIRLVCMVLCSVVVFGLASARSSGRHPAQAGEDV